MPTAHRICPWWLGYFLANPLRRLYQNPRAVLATHVRPGMTVIEIGPGMGFFTLDIARLVGPAGRVVAIDVQPRMIGALRRRAKRAGLLERVETRLVRPEVTGMEDSTGAPTSSSRSPWFTNCRTETASTPPLPGR